MIRKKENNRLGDIVWIWFQILQFGMLANIWPSFRRINKKVKVSRLTRETLSDMQAAKKENSSPGDIV